VKPCETTASEESGGKPLALQIGLGDNQTALPSRAIPLSLPGNGMALDLHV
jgi:hypothetical protein